MQKLQQQNQETNEIKKQRLSESRRQRSLSESRRQRSLSESRRRSLTDYLSSSFISSSTPITNPANKSLILFGPPHQDQIFDQEIQDDDDKDDDDNALISEILFTITEKRTQLKYDAALTSEMISQEMAQRGQIKTEEAKVRSEIVNLRQNALLSMQARSRMNNLNLTQVPSGIQTRIALRNAERRRAAIEAKKTQHEIDIEERALFAKKLANEASRRREKELDNQERHLMEVTERNQERRELKQVRATKMKSAIELVNRTRARAVAIDSVIHSIQRADNIERDQSEKRTKREEVRRGELNNDDLNSFYNNHSNSFGNQNVSGGTTSSHTGFSRAAFLQSLLRVNDADTMSEAKKKKLGIINNNDVPAHSNLSTLLSIARERRKKQEQERMSNQASSSVTNETATAAATSSSTSYKMSRKSSGVKSSREDNEEDQNQRNKETVDW